MLSTLTIALLWIIACPLPALAYLDPGTGSFIFQLVIGSVLAGLTTIKIFWSRIVDKFKPTTKAPPEDES
ncbi:MAG: hypothetical protein K8F91_12615 [Candidatus Obscuribacterales bacterium]|nr:hypothetical protein [Candidatus Obscuribacterales bacterium]